MSPLTLTLIGHPTETVDMSPLVPDRLRGLTNAEIGAVRLWCGNRRLRVRDLFRIAGDDARRLSIVGSTPHFESVGAGMSEGAIDVHGSVGARLGLGMKGGSVHVDGDAGAWAGSSMSGGVVTIDGDAGSFVGAALPGEGEGMTDGTICIGGNAGDRVGDRQQRGLIVIDGDAGDYCGSRMRAGTIIVLGKAGRYVGLGMRRGTVILRRPPRLMSATFNSCGPLGMEVLRLLFRQLPRAHRQLAGLRSLRPFAERFAGDLALGGKGEILILSGRPSRSDVEVSEARLTVRRSSRPTAHDPLESSSRPGASRRR